MMNPITCKVNEVIARNVFLECEKGDDPKQPVFMETADFRPGQRKVRILYDTGNALIAGSDWVAYTMIMAGRTLARHIQSQARNYSNTVEPAEKTLRLSQTDRSYIETFFNVNRSLIKGAGDLLGKATAAAASGIHTLCADTQLQDDNDPVQSAKRHLGVSVLHAAQNVLAGLTMATGSVLGSSRDSAIEIIYKKFGEDAGFLAEQAVGSRKSEVADILVYYDGNGVARQVFVGPNNPSVYAMRQQDLSSNPVTRDPSGAELHESEFFHYARKEEEGVDLRSMIFNYEEEGPDGTAASSLYPAEALAHTDGHSQSSNQSRSEQHIVV
ncbi:hypothetical protein BX666DRAFT_860115 [Dichotomocladium elegans]|nr:hypothetical protein BX666DRAFT_860115 [Dichotomocladium elegans]